ncbi:uncharacterized protein LOC141856343 isoform X2 [Brevipalpus obovatus]
MIPSPGDIGRSLDEAMAYQQQHEQALKKLETKQTPVEKLLSQADDIIASQKTDPIVFSAMAENLALTWKNLTIHLQQRQKTLAQSVNFYRRCEELAQMIEETQNKFSFVIVPENLDTVQKLIEDITVMRKCLLEASMFAMTEQQTLIQLLNEMRENNLYDSRPSYKRQELEEMIEYVGSFLERLQDKRRSLLILFQKRKEELESLYQYMKCSQELEKISAQIKHEQFLLNKIRPGNTPQETSISIYKIDEISKRTRDLGSRTLSMIRQIDSNGESADIQASSSFTSSSSSSSASSTSTSQQPSSIPVVSSSAHVREFAYIVLAECSSLLTSTDEIRQLMCKFGNFLDDCQCVLCKLISMDENLISQQDSRTADMMVKNIQDSVIDISEKGSTLLDDLMDSGSASGDVSPGQSQQFQSFVEPIQSKLNEIQAKADQLLQRLHRMPSEDESKFEKFHSICDDLGRWLDDNVCNFMRNHRELGDSLSSVNDFHDKHRKLANQLETRSVEVNALFAALNQIHSKDVEVDDQLRVRIDDLRLKWTSSSEQLEKRIILSQRFASFHKTFNDILKNLDKLTNDLDQNNITPDDARILQESIVSSKQDLVMINNLASNFIRDMNDCKDPQLDKDQAVTFTKNCLNQLEEVMARIDKLDEKRQEIFDSHSLDQESVIEFSSRIQRLEEDLNTIESFVFPALNADSECEPAIFTLLSDKQIKCKEIFTERCQKTESYLKRFDSLDCPNEMQNTKFELKNRLEELRKKFQDKELECKQLITKITNIFSHIQEIQNYVDDLEKQGNESTEDMNEVEEILKTLSSSKMTIMELIRVAGKESHLLFEEMKETEGQELAQIDIAQVSTILDDLEDRFLVIWSKKQVAMEQRKKLLQFQEDLGSINEQIEELSAQLRSMRDSLGDSLISARNTSISFRQFEKTIENLERKIEVFFSSSEQLLSEDDEEDNVKSISEGIKDLRIRWTALTSDVDENRQLIDSCIKIYEMIDEYEIWLKETDRNVEKIFEDILDNHLQARLTSNLGKLESLQQETEAEESRWTEIRTMSNQLDKSSNGQQRLEQSYSKLGQLKDKIKATIQNAHRLQEDPEGNIEAKRQRTLSQSNSSVQLNRSQSIGDEKLETQTQGSIESAENLEDIIKRTAETLNESIFQQAMEDVLVIQRESPRTVDPLESNNNRSEIGTENESADDRMNLAPKVITPLKNDEFLEKMSFVLKCKFNCDARMVINWYKNEEPIDESSGFRITQTEDGMCCLFIDEPFSTHVGTYKCEASTPEGSVSTECRLTMKCQVPSREPRFARQLSSATVYQAGEDLTIECEVVGAPEPEITWDRDGEKLESGIDGITMITDNGKAAIVIPNVNQSHGGLYTCTAKNLAGTSSTACKVIIDGGDTEQEEESSDAGSKTPVPEDVDEQSKDKPDKFIQAESVDVEDDMKPPNLKLIQGLKSHNCSENRKLTLEAIIEGDPKPEVKWYHNERLINCTDNISVSNEDDHYFLHFNRLQFSDPGTYQCEAISNQGEKIITQCQVTVKESTKSPETLPDRPPFFTRHLSDVSLGEKEMLLLSCAISGQPSPQVTWFRGGEKLFVSPTQHVTEDMESKTYSLVIQEVLLNHTGEYSVQAVNDHGKAESYCRVRVNPNSIGRSPEIISHLTDTYVDPNDSVKLACQIIGFPEPRTTWYLNEMRIEPNNYPDLIFQKDGTEYSLTIPKIQPELEGNYCIVGENEYGRAVSHGQVRMNGSLAPQSMQYLTPDYKPPSNMDSVNVGPTTFHDVNTDSHLTNSSFKMPEINVPILPYKKQHPHFVQENQFKNFVHPPTTTSMPRISNFPPPTEIRNDLSMSTNNFSSINGLKPYGYIGASNTSPARGFLKIERHLMNKIARTGDQVTFECEIIGHPSPTILWYRNGVVIQEGSDWRMERDGNVNRLVIREAFPEDCGLITMKAFNNTASVDSSANLLVRDVNLEPDQPVVRYTDECSSVKQKRDFFTKFVLENSTASSTTSAKARSMSLERKVLPTVPPKPFRLNQVANNNNNLKPTDSYESLPCGYRYSSPSSHSDMSESYLSTQEEGDFKPIWSPKGSNSEPRPRWRPVRAPSSKDSYSKATSTHRYDTGTSLQSTTLSLGSMSRTDSPPSTKSYRPQDISLPPSSDTMSLQAPIFLNGLKDVTVTEGNYVALECEVDGYPPPSIKWFHNDIQIASAQGNRISPLTGGLCRLIVEKTTKEAAGKYCCSASNSIGSISTSCFLRVVPNTML